MSRLVNKHIVLGISGGIAAYKSAELVRQLVTAGAHVRVLMTSGACEFITPLTLQALSGHPVHTELLDEQAEAGMGHIELAKWADLVLVAPATANTCARLAQGLGDDLLATVCLATAAPICVAPAMNQQMWAAPATQRNMQVLQSQGIQIFGPAQGEQACGDMGLGRMEEPSTLAAMVAEQFEHGPLSGKRVVITAGPTREAIDPVRYISNHSSGKMGFSLAQALLDAGAQVDLVAGPVHLSAPEGVNLVTVESAQEMLDAVLARVADADVFVGTAAVADYRPVAPAEQKIKKKFDEMQLELTKNPDIIATVAQQYPEVFTLGFAAETQDVETYAKGKLANKKLNMIACNDVSDQSIGFNSDQNALTVITQSAVVSLEKNDKYKLAQQLVALLVEAVSK